MPPPRATHRRPAAIGRLGVLVAALVALTSGCGRGEADLARELAASRGRDVVLLRRSELAAFPKDSPEHSALAFWRALQLGDAASAWSYIAPQARTSVARRVVRVLAGAPAAKLALAMPRAETHGRRALLRFELAVGHPTPGARAIGGERWAQPSPLALVMLRSRGRWLIAGVRLSSPQRPHR